MIAREIGPCHGVVWAEVTNVMTLRQTERGGGGGGGGGVRAEQLRGHGSIHSRGKFSIRPPMLLLNRHQEHFPRGWSGVGVKMTSVPPFSAEVGNEWSYTSTPAVCVYGMNRDGSIIYEVCDCIRKSVRLFGFWSAWRTVLIKYSTKK